MGKQKETEETLFRLSNGYMMFKEKKKFYFIKTEYYECLRSTLNGLKIETQFNMSGQIIVAGLWQIEISENNTHNNTNMTFENILNGEFMYTTKISSLNKKIIVGISKNRGDVIFDDIGLLSHIIAKISSDDKHKDYDLCVKMNVRLH